MVESRDWRSAIANEGSELRQACKGYLGLITELTGVRDISVTSEQGSGHKRNTSLVIQLNKPAVGHDFKEVVDETNYYLACKGYGFSFHINEKETAKPTAQIICYGGYTPEQFASGLESVVDLLRRKFGVREAEERSL